MNTTLLDAKLFIKGATADQLDELAETLNARRGVIDNEAQYRFPRGTRVYFDSGRRGIINGTVESWKRGGKAVVRPDLGLVTWTVGGSHLRAR